MCLYVYRQLERLHHTVGLYGVGNKLHVAGRYCFVPEQLLHAIRLDHRYEPSIHTSVDPDVSGFPKAYYCEHDLFGVKGLISDFL